MKARQAIEHDIVQLQQRLLRVRQTAAGHAGVEASLCAVRRSNHAVLRERFAALIGQPGMAAAGHFFFEQLYPVQWPAWRDRQCLKTFPRMCRVMPLSACEVLLKAVELDWLTHEIDARAAQGGQGGDCARSQAPRVHEMRNQQRDAVVNLGRGLAAVARLPMMTLLLRWAGPVARRQGLGELHAFFTAGLAAFLAMPDPHKVLDELAAMPV
jgi:hypothetical protein